MNFDITTNRRFLDRLPGAGGGGSSHRRTDSETSTQSDGNVILIFHEK